MISGGGRLLGGGMGTYFGLMIVIYSVSHIGMLVLKIRTWEG